MAKFTIILALLAMSAKFSTSVENVSMEAIQKMAFKSRFLDYAFTSKKTNATLRDIKDYNRLFLLSDLWFLYQTVTYDSIESPFYLAKLGHFSTMRSRVQRMKTVDAYEQIFKIDFVTDYVSGPNFKSDMGNLIISFFIPKEEFLAREIGDAIKGLGTNEKTLIDILCCLGPEDVTFNKIGAAYQRIYGSSMTSDILDDVSGSFKELLETLLSGKRIAGTDDNKARYVAGELVTDTGIEIFKSGVSTTALRVLANSSYEQIALVSKYVKEHSPDKMLLSEYFRKAAEPKGVYGWVKSWTPSWFMDFAAPILFGVDDKYQDMILSIVEYSENKTLYYLNLTQNVAMENDRLRLTRVVSGRADIDLNAIGLLFQSFNERRALENWILRTLPVVGDTPLEIIYQPKDYYRELISKIIYGNQPQTRDEDWIEQWVEYEESHPKILVKSNTIRRT